MKPVKPHYQGRGGIEPIDFIRSNNLNFSEGCCIKYIYRYKFSNTPREDLEDLIQYARWLIEDLE